MGLVLDLLIEDKSSESSPCSYSASGAFFVALLARAAISMELQVLYRAITES